MLPLPLPQIVSFSFAANLPTVVSSSNWCTFRHYRWGCFVVVLEFYLNFRIIQNILIFGLFHLTSGSFKVRFVLIGKAFYLSRALETIKSCRKTDSRDRDYCTPTCLGLAGAQPGDSFREMNISVAWLRVALSESIINASRPILLSCLRVTSLGFNLKYSRMSFCGLLLFKIS